MIAIEVTKIKRVMSNNGKPLGFIGRFLRRSRNIAGMLIVGLCLSNVLPAFRPIENLSHQYLLAASSQTQAPFAGVDRGQSLIWVLFKVAATGNYVAGGDILDLSKLAPAGCGQVPLQTQIFSQPISGTSTHPGYLYFYLIGSTMANGKMQVMQSGSNNQLQELAAGAYPGPITTDNIVGSCAFVYGS